MVDINELFKVCCNDRKRSLTHQSVTFYKKYSIDLVLKLFILLLNSFGRRSTMNSSYFMFSNEIKNSSMEKNLHDTRVLFEQNQLSTFKLEFFTFSRKGHYKIGILKPILIASVFFLRFILTLLISLHRIESLNDKIMNLLVTTFLVYTKSLNLDNAKIYLMTDHHFYSTILAYIYKERSVVLQHGLVQDKSFYLPIRAGRFYAWGVESKRILGEDPRVEVVGTYKFDSIKNRISTEVYSSKYDILFCISSLEREVVKCKIDILYKMCERYGYNLKVKCHQGSMFKLDYWKDTYKMHNIDFYQEELLQDISFDIAFSEDSTCIIDLLVMKKPTILFDRSDGYFRAYKDIMPHGNTEKEIEDCFLKIDTYNFDSVIDQMSKQELNSFECIILQKEMKTLNEY